jgi:ADP-ribosylglycohydrolase
MMNATSSLLGALIGDALALGPHWIYHQGDIQAKLGHVERYHAPMATYHAGKVAGDFTHYGDQTMVLLRSIATAGAFDLGHFTASWRAFWADPKTISYRDGATRAALAGLPSDSHDIAGVGRMAPLFLLKWENDEALLAAVAAQTAFTHGSPEVLAAAEFFARVALAVSRGASIPEALLSAPAAAQRSAASGLSDSAAVEGHGLACSVSVAFPGISHLLLRHPDDPCAALIANVNAGGDSAARGMILGLVYGARFPDFAWPGEWLTEMNAYPEICDRLASWT